MYAVDCNGDGRTDIIHISEGKMWVYTLDSNNNLTLLWQHSDSRIVRKYPPLIGDYNGDGKTDVMFPTYDEAPMWEMDKNTLFATFISTGKGFIKHEQKYPFGYKKPHWDSRAGKLSEYNLIPTDVNNDGKTDILDSHTITYNSSSNGDIHLLNYINTGSLSNGAPAFGFGYFVSKPNVNLRHDPHSLFLSSDKSNYKSQYGILSDQTIHLFNLTRDTKKESELASISQDGIIHVCGL